MHTLNDRQKGLLESLEGAPIGDPSSTLTFERRLARDNGWDERFAHRVVREYKRFLFLAKEAGHPVTPSDEVDQAWHLHMVYTRSYWEDFCGERGLLGFALHHGPTKGGRQEGEKFDDWYARTLASYERMFGEAPPRDIWPDAGVRFGHAPHMRRVDTLENWVIPKRSVWRACAAAVAAAGLASAVGCTVLATSDASGGFGGAGGIGLLALGVLAAVIVVGAIAGAARSSRGGQARRRSGEASASSSGGDGGFWWWGIGGGSSGCGSHHDGSGGDGGNSGCGSSGCGGSGCGGGGCGGGGD